MDPAAPGPAYPPPSAPLVVSGDHVSESQAPENQAPEDPALASTTVFQQTLSEFRKEILEIQPSQVDEFSRTKLEHVQKKVVEIQSKQEASKEMMNLSRLRLFLEQFGNFDKLCTDAGVWGDHAVILSGWIWGPSAWILKTASEHPKTLESVLDAYYRLGKHVPAIHHYQELVRNDPKVAESLAYMYHDLLAFHKTVVRLLRCKAWRKTFESSWKDYGGEFKNLLAHFETHSELLRIFFNTRQQQGAQDDHASIQTITRRLNDFVLQFQDASHDASLNASQIRAFLQRNERLLKDTRQQVNDQATRAADSQQALDHLFSTFEQFRKNTALQFNKLEATRKAEMKQLVLKWMSNQSIKQAEHHTSIRDTRTPQTGEWLLQDIVVCSWLHESTPSTCLVWLRGKMGAGKTVLTSLIIEECLKREKEGFHTSYFYCRKDDAQQNTSQAVLMEILRQMAHKNDDLIAYCNDKSNEDPLGQINVVKHLLEVFCEHATNQFVVIDGLDECDQGDRKTIIDFWKSMVENINVQKPGKLRVFLVSQEKTDIEASLNSFPLASLVYLYPAYTDKDIQTYVMQKSPFIQTRFSLDSKKIRLLENLICERAEGMFLYANLTIENLCRQANSSFYRIELEKNLPKGLSEAYQKTIERLRKTLDANSWIVTKQILMWLAGATRPLRETELAAALAIELNNGRVSFNYRENRLCEDIRVMCGSLVRLGRCEDEARIEFAHSSTRKHLREHMEHEGLGHKRIEFDLTTKCLWYLTLPCFRPGLSSDELAHYARNGYYALQDYASAELRRHIQQLILHTAPMFGLHSPMAAENTTKLVTALKKFLSFYKEIEPLSEGISPADSTAGSRSASPLVTPPYSWESAGDAYSQGSRLVTPVPTARPSPSPTPSTGRPTGPDSNGDPVAFCAAFRGLPELHSHLAQLWTHLYNHQRLVDPEERERVAIPQLRAVIQASRAAIQNLGAPGSRQEDQDVALAMYGWRLYKCERVSCSFFFEGFATAAGQEDDARRHDRPYRCKVDNCPLARFGFPNKKDRDKHTRTYHADTGDAAESSAAAAGRLLADDDVEIDDGDPEPSRRAIQHICAACGKRFTRKANLDSHIDTHNGVRRHSCDACGKAFTRMSDLRRHRKLHERHTRGRRAGL